MPDHGRANQIHPGRPTPTPRPSERRRADRRLRTVPDQRHDWVVPLARRHVASRGVRMGKYGMTDETVLSELFSSIANQMLIDTKASGLAQHRGSKGAVRESQFM